MAPKIQTVLGDVNPDDLGCTLTHEHLSMEFTHFYREPPAQLADKFIGKFALNTVGYLRQYPYSWRENLILNDEEAKTAVLNDVLAYKKYGGGTIVENTTQGIQRDINFYKQVSQQTNVHIVAGTGHYIADLQANQGLSVEELHDHMLKELTVGCVDSSDVKAGFMGEIASVWPLKDFEKRAIRASGEVQEQTGFGVSFHPHREAAAPFEIIRLYLEAGGKADKAVMSHLDRTLLDTEKLLEFGALGTYCQFDLFGVEVSVYQLHTPTPMPSDAQRIERIRALVDDGRRVTVSHDIHTKHRLIDFGGHGYSHIINNVLPVMKARGFSQETIDEITITNPARWLAVDKQ